MANEFDDRILRISIEIAGQLRIYEGLYMTASGTKYGNANQNECEVKIANLPKEDRDYLVTETSPFNKSKERKKLIVEAGRVSTGASIIFTGDIISATPSQPPDIMTTIKAKTGNFLKGKATSRTAAYSSSVKDISQKAADDMGLSLQFEATDKNVTNHSYCGATLKQVNDIEDTGDYNAYIDNDKLIVKDANIPLKNTLRILNKDTGMIGIPEIDEQGIKCKMFFDNKTVLGGGLQIESVINPAVNGTYVIYILGFDLASRDTNWYLMPQAKRLNR